MSSRKLFLILAAASLVRCCFHFPALLIWILGAAIIFIAVIRPWIIIARDLSSRSGCDDDNEMEE